MRAVIKAAMEVGTKEADTKVVMEAGTKVVMKAEIKADMEADTKVVMEVVVIKVVMGAVIKVVIVATVKVAMVVMGVAVKTLASPTDVKEKTRAVTIAADTLKTKACRDTVKEDTKRRAKVTDPKEAAAVLGVWKTTVTTQEAASTALLKVPVATHTVEISPMHSSMLRKTMGALGIADCSNRLWA